MSVKYGEILNIDEYSSWTSESCQSCWLLKSHEVMRSLLFLSTFSTCPKMVFAEAPPAPADPVAEIVTPVKAVAMIHHYHPWPMTLIRPVFRMAFEGFVFLGPWLATRVTNQLRCVGWCSKRNYLQLEYAACFAYNGLVRKNKSRARKWTRPQLHGGSLSKYWIPLQYCVLYCNE